MKIVYLLTILFFSQFFNVNRLFSIEKNKTSIQTNIEKKKKASEENKMIIQSNKAVLKDLPKLKIDELKNKVVYDVDIFSHMNLNPETLKNNSINFKLLGIIEAKGSKSIIISSFNKINTYQKGEIINNRYEVSEISLKPSYVILLKDKKEQKIFLNK